jgi:hypothetical protein
MQKQSLVVGGEPNDTETKKSGKILVWKVSQMIRKQKKMW